jgi:hypothetical protein
MAALAAGLLPAAMPMPALGASDAYLSLQVTFAGSLSVSIDGAAESTRTINAGANALVVASSATVANDSSGFTERWQLAVATVSGNGDWAVLSSTQAPPDVDEYAFQALFISSATTLANQPAGWSNGCPAANASDWDSFASTVTGASTLYDSAMYADPTAIGGASGAPDAVNGNMLPYAADGRGARGLRTRIYMPVGTEVIDEEQVIRLNVTAVPGS